MSGVCCAAGTFAVGHRALRLGAGCLGRATKGIRSKAARGCCQGFAALPAHLPLGIGRWPTVGAEEQSSVLGVRAQGNSIANRPRLLSG
eukprot:8187512-Alexandrium_andersonii.AAC.1